MREGKTEICLVRSLSTIEIFLNCGFWEGGCAVGSLFAFEFFYFLWVAGFLGVFGWLVCFFVLTKQPITLLVKTVLCLLKI